MKMRLQDRPSSGIINLKKLLTKLHVAVKLEDKIRTLENYAFLSVVLSFHCRQSDEKILLPWQPDHVGKYLKMLKLHQSCVIRLFAK